MVTCTAMWAFWCRRRSWIHVRAFKTLREEKGTRSSVEPDVGECGWCHGAAANGNAGAVGAWCCAIDAGFEVVHRGVVGFGGGVEVAVVVGFDFVEAGVEMVNFGGDH